MAAPRPAVVAPAIAILVAAVVAVRHDDTPELVLGLVLVAFLVPLALIDLATRLLPNALTAPAAVLAVVLGTALDPGGEVERLVAGAAAGGFFLAAALASPRGMGMGDVKLAAVLGLFLGREVALAVLVALARRGPRWGRWSSRARASPRAAGRRWRSARSSPSAGSPRCLSATSSSTPTWRLSDPGRPGCPASCWTDGGSIQGPVQGHAALSR